MAKKRTTLPKDFEELLKKGDLQELKDVFSKCEVDARGGFSKQTALAFDLCPHDLAKWLVGQGLDLQARDNYGDTPLHRRSRSIFGNIESLLALGADVNDKGKYANTPLHAAADSHNVENTRLLLVHGAQADALNSSGYTPLEQALRTCSNSDIVKTVELSRMYLNAGVQVTPGMKEAVTEIGKKFEFMRDRFNKDSVDEFSSALEELYGLFGVEPVVKRVLHDGKMPIITSAKTWQEQHQELWDLLVPATGAAETIQGEVIRITGKMANELEGNGGINWDGEYKKMADAFLTYVRKGNSVSSAELEEAGKIVDEVKRKSGDVARLCELGVKWVIGNPGPLALLSVEYKR